LGIKSLIQLIKNYKTHANIQTKLTLGVIGFPNVGKESVIQSLAAKSKRNKGGITIAPDIVLQATPGSLIASLTDGNREDAILRNAIDIKFLPEPFLPIKTIVQRCPKELLLQLYKIPVYNFHVDFLRRILGKTTKKILNTDLINTARQVLEDWNTGKIPYHTTPPETTPNDDAETTPNDDDSTGWRNDIKMKQIIQIEKSNVLDKLEFDYQKIMFSVPIKPLDVVIHPSWLLIDRTPEDPLDDIKEEIPRRKQKENKLLKNQRTKKNRLSTTDTSQNYDFNTDFK